MFTGLVEGLGRVRSVVPEGAALRLVVSPPPDMTGDSRDSAVIGASIAVNGCCLTLAEIVDGGWVFQAGAETLSKTTLGTLAAGDAVNLERSLPANGRFGGHIVQGHVDGVATVVAVEREGEWVTLWFGLPPSLAAQMVPKGSAAVDGVSLTVVQVENDRFSVALIPHTLDVTTLGLRGVGDGVNIETDILGKYVQRAVAAALRPERER